MRVMAGTKTLRASSMLMAGVITLAVHAGPACGGHSSPTVPSAPVSPTSTAPPASAGHSLVYANHVGMVVLVNAGLGDAGRPASSTPTRVWGWAGAEWRLIDSSGPPVRNLSGVTYDTRRQTLIMHGGTYDLGRSYGETWEWSAGWRQVASPGPGIRDHTQLAYDADRGRAVLFGGSGEDPNVAFGDTWEFDGAAWTRAASDGPPGRVHHAMQYDVNLRQVVLVGGNTPSGVTLGDVWAWDGARWAATGSMAPRSHARMTFDRTLGGLVLVGGFTPGFDMLINRGGLWTGVPSSSDPGPRYLTDIAYDERRRVLVLFGGVTPGGTVLNDTWEFDGRVWRRVG